MFRTRLNVDRDWVVSVGESVMILELDLTTGKQSWIRELSVREWVDTDVFVGQDVDTGEIFAVDVLRTPV